MSDLITWPGIVAYFSMEIGLDPAMPTYSGGLGVLAGDSVRAAADLGVPMVALTLIHRSGYFRQQLDSEGNQTEGPALWSPEDTLEPLEPRVSVTIEGRTVHIRAWRRIVHGVSGASVPVYLLDSNLPENQAEDRALTDELYGGDSRYRLSQEVILGIGGVLMLRALGHDDIRAYHMNEGHSGLLTLALLEEHLAGRDPASATEADFEAVRRKCVFTVHTPVAAGHDRFAVELVSRVLPPHLVEVISRTPSIHDGSFDLTHLTMFFCRSANGVSLRHGQISRDMFPQYEVDEITNGVHAGTWVSPPFADLYDRHIPMWRRDNRFLRHAVTLPPEEIRDAHDKAKTALFNEVDRRTGVRLDSNALTIGFARRATAYKRADMLFSDLNRLRRIAQRVGPLQVVYAGKAHPRDEQGQAIIRNIFAAAAELKGTIPVIYLQDYDMSLAGYICAGVDLWLNNPQKPLEASGTSGMKTALNGIPSLSVLDGWWIEGHIEGVTGWSIGDGWETVTDFKAEITSLYDKLEYTIIPMFYQRPSAWAQVMRSCIAVNGSFFNAQRMMSQYAMNVYAPPHEGAP
jgi:glycogen phosphorylase